MDLSARLSLHLNADALHRLYCGFKYYPRRFFRCCGHCPRIILQNADLLFYSALRPANLHCPAFRIIGISFLPAVLSLLSPVFFQAIGNARISALLSLIRQLGCLIPIFWLLSKLGLSYTWIAFPASEIITGFIGVFLYLRQVREWDAG